MATTIIGNPEIGIDALATMKENPYTYATTRWAVYQNHDLGSRRIGELRFLAVGPENTLQEPPARYPDTHLGTGWAYLHVGWVDLATGKIVPISA